MTMVGTETGNIMKDINDRWKWKTEEEKKKKKVKQTKPTSTREGMSNTHLTNGSLHTDPSLRCTKDT